MTKIKKRPITFWVSCAVTILILLVILGGGAALIVTGNQAMEGAPDMVKGAAAYGMGWALLSGYVSFATYCYVHNDKERIDKLEKEISEIKGEH